MHVFSRACLAKAIFRSGVCLAVTSHRCSVYGQDPSPLFSLFLEKLGFRFGTGETLHFCGLTPFVDRGLCAHLVKRPDFLDFYQPLDGHA